MGTGDSPRDSPLPIPSKSTMPFTISYSRLHTGHPTTPETTDRPFISAVESTRNASACDSGQRSISVSSMCIGSGPELDPGELAGFDANATEDLLAFDGDAEGVLARRHDADGEVLV